MAKNTKCNKTHPPNLAVLYCVTVLLHESVDIF